MKLMKLYEEIKDFETDRGDIILDHCGDLFIQHPNQLYKHFLDRINYNFDGEYIIFYSPKLEKTFKVSDKDLTQSILKVDNKLVTLDPPIYVFGYSPKFLNEYDEEFKFSDGGLKFTLEVLY